MNKFGLTTEEASKALSEQGNNALTQPPRETFWDKLWENFKDPIIRILILALLVNVVFVYMGHGDWIETMGIFLAIILATFVSTYSEYSNENAFQKLQEEASRIRCKVWRDGEPVELHIDDIVVGDAVILEAGDKVPVDGILLDGDVKLDQAALNGESKEAHKLIAPPDFTWGDGTIDFLDEHKLFRGSVVVEGQGIMQAVKIGDSSIYGQLTQELKDDERDSPLKLKLKGLAHHISQFGYAGGVLIALAVMLHKAYLYGDFGAYFANTPLLLSDLVQAVILGIIIIVMAVPEGLPLMIAIVSSLNMKKMLRDNVLVRKLVGIETAGSLNLLFTDKTGTITKGKLEVVRFITGDRQEYPAFDVLPAKLKAFTYQNVVLNTSAAVSDGAMVGGNMTERALSNYVGSYRMEEMLHRDKFIPFNSANKYSWAAVSGNGERYCLAKGAPEKLILQTSHYWDAEGNRQPLTEEMKKTLDDRMLELAADAIRMLALCTYESDIEGDELPADGLTLVGILGIRDEVRPEAIEAIAEVQDAGVQIVMITGDRRETAVAIAKDAGLLQRPNELVWTSAELAEMSDEQVKLELHKLRVVARALPMDKSRLVRLAQEMNLVVGMTGDGVNDSPALKKADVGFAMGSGTEVAKEAGDIVILDDNFLSIKQAILYGRTIYNSICKFIVFQLTINFVALLIVLLGSVIGTELPLTVTQMLWVNLIMDTFAALALASIPPSETVMLEKPRRSTDFIISKAMRSNILGVGSIFLIVLLGMIYYFDHSTEGMDIHNLTIFFTFFVMLQFWNLFNARVFGTTDSAFKGLSKSYGMELIVLAILAGQFLIVQFGGAVFRTEPLNWQTWLLIIGVSSTVLWVGELIRLVQRSIHK